MDETEEIIWHICEECDAEFKILQPEGFEDIPYYCPYCGTDLIEN